MNNEEKTQLMKDTAQDLVKMIQKRLTSRLNALTALQGSPMDFLTDEVKKMREIESSNIRSVMQEQSDLIEIINLLFPQVPSVTVSTKDKKS